MPRIAMPRTAPLHDEARQEVLHAMQRRGVTAAEMIRLLNREDGARVSGNTVYRYLQGKSDSMQSLVTRMKKILGLPFKGVDYDKIQ